MTNPVAPPRHSRRAELHRAFQALVGINTQQARVTRHRILAALMRLNEGTYGDCLACGRSIPRWWLDAEPWRESCTACQETA